MAGAHNCLLGVDDDGIHYVCEILDYTVTDLRRLNAAAKVSQKISVPYVLSPIGILNLDDKFLILVLPLYSMLFDNNDLMWNYQQRVQLIYRLIIGLKGLQDRGMTIVDTDIIISDAEMRHPYWLHYKDNATPQDLEHGRQLLGQMIGKIMKQDYDIGSDQISDLLGHSLFNSVSSLDDHNITYEKAEVQPVMDETVKQFLQVIDDKVGATAIAAALRIYTLVKTKEMNEEALSELIVAAVALTEVIIDGNDKILSNLPDKKAVMQIISTLKGVIIP